MARISSHDPQARGRWAATINGLLPLISAALVLGLIMGLVIVKVFHPGGSAMSMSGTASTAQQAVAVKKVTLNFTEGDMYIRPSTVTVPTGADVTVHIINKGPSQHTLALEGRSTPLINPGQSLTEHWGVLTHSVQAWCLVTGHKEAGMLVNVNVAGSKPATAAAATGAAGNSNDAKIDPNAQPPKGWTPRNPTLPAARGTVHNVTFTITQHNIEVAPGVTQQRWTYNGTAPGPILHGKVGDTFDIHLVNDGTMPHSIDFHASQVAPNIDMRTIQPHQSLDYRFTAHFAGIFTYHCDASPMIDHIGNGMYGAIVIDPPHLDKVARELYLVQSELYLGPQGQPGDMTKMMAGQPDAVVFNGYYNQYAFAPIQVKAGDRVRVWLDDIGPNEPMDFHVVGTVFDTVWKEGRYELSPGNADQGGAQALDLQPTQGGFVEFTIPAAGVYPFITHKMMDASKGALGLFQAS